MSRFYKIVLDDPQAEPDVFCSKQTTQAALSLARAEARLERVKQEEARHAERLNQYIERRGRKAFAKLGEGGLDDPEALEFMIRREKDPLMRQGLQVVLNSHPGRAEALRGQGRSLARYRSEAEAQRRKALSRWLEVKR